MGFLYVILDACTTVLCLNALYGEKVKLDINTILYIIFDCAIMRMITQFNLNQGWSVIVYFFIALYCLVEFKEDIITLVVNMMLFVIILACVQIVVSVIFSCVSIFNEVNQDIGIILINTAVLTIIWFLYVKKLLKNISGYFQKKEVLLTITLVAEIVIVIFLLLQYKKLRGMLPTQYILLAVLFTFMMILCLYMFLYKTKYQEKNKELEAYKTYHAAFDELVTEIRVRQHEFDNHINAICNLHYVCDKYDELVAEQSKYAADVINDNKFNKLLSAGNPVLSGFLYGRLRTIESKGILTSYKINIGDMESKVPVYLIIELIGNLLNNAVDALSNTEGQEKQLYVECIEDNEKIAISVWNTSRKISYSEMENFFEKGYSSKGEQRGLGLYHVKKICIANNIDIICGNRDFNGINWIVFELYIRK